MPEQTKTECPTGLNWKDKRTEVDRIVLPFQTIETINESRASREKEKNKGKDFFKDSEQPQWYNRLIWGDNKYIMSSLLEEFAGQIDLIYIDPPFATGADFSVKIEVGDVEWTKEPSAIEDKAYRDTWGKGLDSYLQMMYDRIVLLRELLSEKGSLFIHLGIQVNHYIRVILEEIFGKENEIDEIIWSYGTPSGGRAAGNKIIKAHEYIIAFAKNYGQHIYNKIYLPYDQKYIDERFIYYDENGRRYRTRGRGNGLIEKQYLDESPGVPLSSVWSDIKQTYAMHLVKRQKEELDYPTQKPEALLERIIKISSNENDIVADFFCGSGTTAAVAEKLGRRWIAADLSRYAIHTTRKRMLGIEGCKPFIVQNLGKYERQYWQGVTFNKRKDEQVPLYEYIQFILKLYNAEPLTGLLHIHGKKGKRLVHIGAVDVPVTLSEIKEAIEEVKKLGQDSLDVLGWEWEMGLHDVVENESKESGVKLRLFYIPRDVMDPRAVEKGDITFYELAYLETEVEQTKNGVKVKLKDFAIPNLDLIPTEVRDKIKKWSDYIDYWAVDWDWNGDAFHNMWQSYRTKKERKLELQTDPHLYEEKGKHLIMVKVIDIFGNDTTRVLEVKI